MTDVSYHIEQAKPPSTTMERSGQADCNVQKSRRLVSQGVFSDITATFGVSFVPDLFAALESTPAHLEAAWKLFQTELDLEGLDARTKRIIALATTTNASGTYQIAACRP